MKLLIKQTTLLRHSAIYPIIILSHRKLLYFNTTKPIEKAQKNHYKTSSKTTINNDKNMNKRQAYNQQKINWL